RRTEGRSVPGTSRNTPPRSRASATRRLPPPSSPLSNSSSETGKRRAVAHSSSSARPKSGWFLTSTHGISPDSTQRYTSLSETERSLAACRTVSFICQLPGRELRHLPCQLSHGDVRAFACEEGSDRGSADAGSTSPMRKRHG